MKRTTLLLFFISPFCLASAYAQSPDLPLFDDVESQNEETECVACRKYKKVPNVGIGAEPVDSIQFAPSPFPPVKVTMTSDEPLPEKPFKGVNKSYEHRYTEPATYETRTSAPVDFSDIKNTEKTTEEVKVAPKAVASVPKETPKKKEVSVQTEQKNQEPKKPSVQKKPAFQRMASPNNTKLKPSMSAKNLNIADLQLTMTPDDIIETAADNGFEIANVAYGIPSFMVTDFERGCRASGLYQTRLIHECVREKAREEDVYYISSLTLKKPETKEQIVVLFSSTLTDNQAFKIDYTGFGDNSLGTSYKDVLKKANRRDIFWQYIYDKYGQPIGKDVVFWGDANGVFMRAFMDGNALDARIILEDATKKGADYRQAEAWNKDQEVQNPFSF